MSPWDDAVSAAALFAIDPVGTGGASLRAFAGPARDRWLALLRELLPAASALRRVPLHISDARLLGGLDLVATLRAGRPVAERGLLAEADGGVLMLAMAERLAPATAARVTATLDTGAVTLERDGLALRLPTRFGVVALDEGLALDERPTPGLLDRLAFHLDLSTVAVRDLRASATGGEDIAAARRRLRTVAVGEESVEALCTAASALGIASIRAPLLALRAACAAAALAGRDVVTETDLAMAGRLVLAPRATRLPPAEQADPPDVPPDQPAPSSPDDEPDTDDDTADAADDADPRGDENAGDAGGLDPSAAEIVMEAAQSALPPGVLARLRAGPEASRMPSSGRAGAVHLATRRGRPAGVRQGEPRAGARLNVVETVRAAAPWQPLRRGVAGKRGPAERTPQVRIHREDFRVSRYRHRAQTTTIFVVDASGSTALHRLAEAKGAVELLLADCYVRRDRVALLAFRGRDAELLLPPTRSLVRAKRSLAGLPGGGATPLAAALRETWGLSDAVRRRGDTPVAVILTDGTGNVTLDGRADRAEAEQQTVAAARQLRASGLTALLIDTSPRPRPAAERLASELGASYLPLPYANAAILCDAVRAQSVAGSVARSATTSAGAAPPR